MEKLSMKSPDLTARNIEQMAELFPQLVTETIGEDGKLRKAIDFELLKQELSDVLVEGDKERYQLTWPGKKEAILNANTPIDKTLRPVKEDSVNWDTTENLYIEGDNLEVLKLLQESYLGKVKCIYIDPPYNTGNDFVYRDDYSESVEEYLEESGQVTEEGRLFKNTDTNGRFHSDWLTMIYARLKVARTLLAEDGVLFISIDDGEIHQLRKVCDDVFGAGNFRNHILTGRRIKSLNSQFAGNGLRTLNIGFEYVLVYAKNESFLMRALRMKKANASSKGRWDVFWSNADRPTMRYEVLGFTPTSGQWRYSKEKADIAIANYQLYMNEYSAKMTLEEYWKTNGENQQFIRRIVNGTGKNGGVQHWVPPSETSLRTSNWLDIEVSQIHKEINLPFDNPKSKDLILELMKLANTEKDSFILDFFSGSATTAHAVMQLNAEDGGNRKYIMVQVPEPTPETSEAHKAGYSTICEIGKERIRRAAKKIQTETGADIDYGFRVYRTDSSNMKDIYYTPDKLGQADLLDLADNIKEDRTGEDLLIQVMLEKGLPLSLPMESKVIDGCTVHHVAGNSLVACFDGHIPSSLLQRIAQEDKPLRFVCRDASFADDSARINVEEIFKLFSPTTDIQVL